MAFNMRNVTLSQSEGEALQGGADGLLLNGEPVLYHVNGTTFVKDICILTKKKLAELVSDDGPGVEVRDQVRKHLKEATKPRPEQNGADPKE